MRTPSLRRLLWLPLVSERWVAIAGFGLALAIAGEAQAGGTRGRASNVVVVADTGDHFAGRLRAELEALGFHAIEATSTQVSLEESAWSSHAVAAVRATSSGGEIEIWMTDRETGKPVSRVLRADGTGAEREAALALQAVELLRATFLEIDSERPKPIRSSAANPAALDPSRPPSQPRASLLRLGIGIGLTSSPGHVGPSASIAISGEWMPHPQVGVLVIGSLPLVEGHFDNGTSSTKLAPYLGGVAVRGVLSKEPGPFFPSLDLGLSVVTLRATGAAPAPLISAVSSATSAAPFARAGLAFALTSRLRVRADVLAGVLVHPARIHFAGAEVARWGTPFVFPTLALDVGAL